MQDFVNKKIVLGICGGIAAYKSAFLLRELTRKGAQVRVVMTESAKQFITPLTLQALSGYEVRSEMFDSQAERAMGHIELARWADYLVIAPATADIIAKFAHGFADDLLSTLYLVNEKPLIICPAMNRSMWQHAATQDNCEQLKQRGALFVGPDAGEQACGELGLGRLSEVDAIIDAIRLQAIQNTLSGKRVIITAGRTQEAIDPVRYLSNHSSGKMGYALAKAAQVAGAEVVLISGQTDLPKPNGIQCYPVKSAMDMHQAVMDALQDGDIFIACAAVADYRPETVSPQKIKKQKAESMTLNLLKNPDIVAEVAASGKVAYTVGFAAETEHLLENARQKRLNKKLDMIVANQVGSDCGFGKEENQVVVITESEQIELSLTNKVRLAGQLIAIIATSLQNDAQNSCKGK